MKNKFYPFHVLILTLLIGVASCSDNENELTDKSTLVGKWSVQTITDEDGVYNYEHECSSKKDYIEFKSNDTFIDVYYDEDCAEDSYSGTYAVSGNKLTLSTEESAKRTYTFSITDDVLKLEGDGETVRLKKN